MQNSPNDYTNTMTVDIRLCGDIPRNEMKARFGAPCPTTALTSQAKHLSTSRLAVINGSPTLHKTALCDQAFPVLTIQNTDNIMLQRNVLTEMQQPFAPVLEPPSWAVPARGETRLEVRLILLRLFLTLCPLSLTYLLPSSLFHSLSASP